MNSSKVAKKYPMKGKLKGSIYGTPKISSLLASFESDVMQLHNARPYYKPNSRTFDKHQDRIRLKAAQAIMDLLSAHTKGGEQDGK